MKNYVYLAGSITQHQQDENLGMALIWRGFAEDRLTNANIDCYNPCQNYKFNKDYSRKSFLQQNRLYLDKSNIILVDLYKICQSGGTLYELAVAYHKGMQIVSFGDISHNISDEIFGHYREIVKSGMNFQTCEQAVDFICIMFDQ